MTSLPPSSQDNAAAIETSQLIVAPTTAPLATTENDAAASEPSVDPPSPAPFKRGHASKPSVGIAASLFGSGGDEDPFSAISASNGPSSLTQLTEVKEEPDLFGSFDASNPHSHLNDATSAVDPVSSLFGTDSATSVPIQSPAAAASAASTTDGLTVPTIDGNASAPASGPASPGALFADLSYQDDWLASTTDQNAQHPAADVHGENTTIHQADPFGAADGGQGSLSWLNQQESHASVDPATESQLDAYGRPIVAYEGDDQQEQYPQDYGYHDQQGYGYDKHHGYNYSRPQASYDQPEGHDYHQQGYGSQEYGQQQVYDYQENGYDQQTYDQPQTYDQQNYHQQGFDQHTYAQQDYSQSGYEQRAYDQHDANQYNYEQFSYQDQNYTVHATTEPYAATPSANDAIDVAEQSYNTDAYADYPAHQANAHSSAGYEGYAAGPNNGYDAATSGRAYDAAATIDQSTQDQYSTDPHSAYESQGYTQQPSVADSYTQQQQSRSYDPYAPPMQAQQQAHSYQSYSHSADSVPPSTFGYDAGAYGDVQGVSASRNQQGFVRAPSPYDPPAATASPAAPLSATANDNSLPPPPMGPPQGPLRGPPRGPSRSASRNMAGSTSSASLDAPPLPKRTSSAVSLEDESQQEPTPTWPNGTETPQKQSQPLLGSTDTPPTTYTRPSSAWVDSLEQAAATPPTFSSGDDSLPKLTITDESKHAYSNIGEAPEIETSMREVEQQLSDKKLSTAVDDATIAFDHLNLDQSQQMYAGRSSQYENGYSEEDTSTPQPSDQNADGYGADYGTEQNGQFDAEGGHRYDQFQSTQQSSDWNSWNEEGASQAPTTIEHNPYAPSDPQQQQEILTAPTQSGEAYSDLAYGSEQSKLIEDPYDPSPQAHDPPRLYTLTGQDDSEAKTPLAAHDEQDNWLGSASPALGNDAAQDPYSSVSGSTFVTGAQNGAAPHSGYDPYGPPSVNDRSIDTYGAHDGHARVQPEPAASVEDAYTETDQLHEQSNQATYFDSNKRAGSPQQYGYGHVYGASDSAYAPLDQYDSSAAGTGQGPRSAASDTRSQSASETSADMLQAMRSATIPIASFGIGGKLVSYFPTSRASTGAEGADGAGGSSNVYGSYSYNTSSYPTQLKIQSLSSLVSSTAYASAFDPLTFPGPVYEGPSGTNALSRATGAASASKTKKAAVLKHLEERIQELSAGVGYLRRRPSFSASSTGSNRGTQAAQDQDGELEARRTEDKVLLLRLLRLLVENDGQTSSNAFEQGVRSLIIAPDTQDVSSSRGFAMSVTSTTPDDGAEGSVVTSHELRTSFLQKVQGMLLCGERKEAVDYAVAQRMWAHAMTIASCVDKECWKEVVSEFIEHEVGAAEASLAALGQGDLQGLKVAYNVFSGQDPVSIFDLFRTKTQLGQMGGLQPAQVESTTTPSALPSWKESAAIVASNRSASDSAALTAIGDGLCTRGLLEAAHFCYLLSPQTSPIGGADTSGARFTLLGLSSPKASAAFVQDLDGILMTEVLEFAQGLVPAVKGQEPFPGIAHLQAYKLVHAQHLADLGEVSKAQRYCEAIAQCLKQSKASPYLHSTLLSQSKQLSDRLVGAPQTGPGGNWVTRKMQRPTLDGVWGALEGRFTKFIAGEEGAMDADSPNKNSKGSVSSSIGPFSHYSAITPDAASGGMTRQPSFNELRTGSPSVPTSRSGSAMDFRNATKRAASPKHRASTALSMRPLNSDPYSDWPQPRAPGNGTGSEAASNYDRDSVRSSSEMPRGAYGYGASLHTGPAQVYGHGAQVSAFSTASSTYGGPAETSFASNAAPWNGSAGQGTCDTDSSRRPSADAGALGAGSESAYGGYGGSSYGGYGGTYGEATQTGGTDGEVGGDAGGSSATGHANTPFYGYDPHGAQKPQFVSNVNAGDALEGGGQGGFVSPFDALSSISQTPQPPSQGNQYTPSYSRHHADVNEEEDDDDLGLGNSSGRRKASNADGTSFEAGDASPRDSVASSSAAHHAAKQNESEGKKDDTASNASGSDEKRQELKPSASWFGRLWGRSPSTDSAAQQAQAKAKKAHLGEETSFVYDKELKRWVNKKAGDSGSASSTPPPPPPRTQSASPASQPDRSTGASSAPPMRGPPSGTLTMGRATPPISEGNEEGSSGLAPSRGPPGMGSLSRARSNLADHSMPPASQPPMGSAAGPVRGSGASTPAGGVSGPPPPPGGSRMGTVKKRPIKSRYVVVD